MQIERVATSASKLTQSLQHYSSLAQTKGPMQGIWEDFFVFDESVFEKNSYQKVAIIGKREARQNKFISNLFVVRPRTVD